MLLNLKGCSKLWLWEICWNEKTKSPPRSEEFRAAVPNGVLACFYIKPNFPGRSVCFCPNCKLYLSKLSIVFVHIVNCICTDKNLYFYILQIVFVQNIEFPNGVLACFYIKPNFPGRLWQKRQKMHWNTYNTCIQIHRCNYR